ncbi:MAG: hypothetical protein AAF739_16615 [Pseudomonadota bacterium]
MFDRGVLFVGTAGVGLGVLAEVIAIDELRQVGRDLPLRIYSATTHEDSTIDTALQRAMARLPLDSAGSGLKPLGLYAFAGAPRIDHVVMIDGTLPRSIKLALGSNLDVRTWDMQTAEVHKLAPGQRVVRYLELASRLRPRIADLVTELTALDGINGESIAHSA